MIWLSGILLANYTYNNIPFYLVNKGDNNGVAGEDVNFSSVIGSKFDGSGINIRVNDNGIMESHNCYKNQLDHQLLYDFGEDDRKAQPRYVFYDIHGTSVLGLMASDRSSECPFGISPKANYSATIILYDGLRVGDVNTMLIKDIDKIDIQVNAWTIEACENGKCNSMRKFHSLIDAISETQKRRNEKGQIILFSAGNAYEYLCDANFQVLSMSKDAFMIGSTTNRGDHAFYSCRGTSLIANTPSSATSSIHLPEEPKLLSTSNLSPYSVTTRFGGTSASSPIAAGIIALALQANENLSSRDVQFLIALSSTKNDPHHFTWKTNSKNISYSSLYGYGRLNAGQMIDMAQKWNIVLPKQSFVQNSSSGILHDDFCEIPIYIDASLQIEVVCIDIMLHTSEYSNIVIDIESPSKTISNLKTAAMINENVGKYNRSFVSRNFLLEDSKGEWKIRVKAPYDSDTNNNVKAAIKIYGIKEKIEIPQKQSILGKNPLKEYKEADVIVEAPSILVAGKYTKIKIKNNFPNTTLFRFYLADKEMHHQLSLGMQEFTVGTHSFSFFTPTTFKDKFECLLVVNVFEFNSQQAHNIIIHHDNGKNELVESYTYFRIFYHTYKNSLCYSNEILCSIYYKNKEVNHSVIPNIGYVEIKKSNLEIERIILTEVESTDIRAMDFMTFDIQYKKSFLVLFIQIIVISTIIVYYAVHFTKKGKMHFSDELPLMKNC